MNKATAIVAGLVPAIAITTSALAGGGGGANHTVCTNGCNYTTIQDAINAASSGDTITITDADHHESSINTMGKGVTIRGLGESQTRIWGDYADSVFIVDSGEQNTTHFENFTLRQGGKLDGSTTGGGFRILNSSPSICDVTITDCHASSGGGIYAQGNINHNDNITISDCQITQNTASSDQSGGGVYCFESNISIENTVFEQNDATTHDYGTGAGLSSQDSHIQILGCTFKGNNATNSGGGATIMGSFPVGLLYTAYLDGCTFDNNTACGGGGLHIYGGNKTTMNSCTFVNNTANDGETYHLSNGGGLLCRDETILECYGGLFQANNTNQTGGGASLEDGCQITMAGTQFINNRSSMGGGGIYAASFGLGGITDLDLETCKFKNNEGGSGFGGGMYVDNFAHAVVHNCHFIFNSDVNGKPGGAIWCMDDTSGGNSSHCIMQDSTICANSGQDPFHCYNQVVGVEDDSPWPHGGNYFSCLPCGSNDGAARGDMDGDGDMDADDLNVLHSELGVCEHDVNHDGTTDIQDILDLISGYGLSCQ